MNPPHRLAVAGEQQDGAVVDDETPKGTIESKPDIFGGKDYRLPSGERIESRPNIFGGQDFRQPNGHVVECRPNIFGGEDCR